MTLKRFGEKYPIVVLLLIATLFVVLANFNKKRKRHYIEISNCKQHHLVSTLPDLHKYNSLDDLVRRLGKPDELRKNGHLDVRSGDGDVWEEEIYHFDHGEFNVETSRYKPRAKHHYTKYFEGITLKKSETRIILLCSISKNKYSFRLDKNKNVISIKYLNLSL